MRKRGTGGKFKDARKDEGAPSTDEALGRAYFRVPSAERREVRMCVVRTGLEMRSGSEEQADKVDNYV